MFQHLTNQLVQKAPSLLRVPLKTTPFIVKQKLIEKLINWQFKQALDDGELTFLQDRWLKIDIRDLQLSGYISLQQGVLKVSESAPADVTFSSNMHDLILVAAKKQDPDTLFFQRRLMVEGDTELGLYVKNLMDSIELDAMPTLLRVGLMQLAELIESSQPEGAGQSRVSSYANQN